MATASITWTNWDATDSWETLADAGDSGIVYARVADAAVAAQFTQATKNVTESERGVKAGAGDSWATIFGISTDAQISSVQVTAWSESLVSATKLSSHSIIMRLVDDAGDNVCGAGTELISTSISTATHDYTAGAAGSIRAVQAAYVEAATNVRLELAYTVTTSNTGGSAAVDQRFDAVTIQITYSSHIQQALDASSTAIPAIQRKIGKQVPTALIQFIGLSMNTSKSFWQQSIAVATTAAATMGVGFLDWIAETLGGLRYPLLFWRGMGVPATGPAGAQTYFQTLAASELSAPSMIKLASLFRSVAASDTVAMGIQRGMGARISSESSLTGSTATVLSLYRSVAAQLIESVTLASTQSYTRLVAAALLSASNLAQLLIWLLAISAAAVSSAVLSKKIAKTLSSQSVTAFKMAQSMGTVARTVAAQLLDGSSVVERLERLQALATSMAGTATVSKLASLFRAVNPGVVLSTTISRFSNVAQAYQQAIDAALVDIAGMVRGFAKTLSTEAVLAAAISRSMGLVTRAISAAIVEAASMARPLVAAVSLSTSSAITPGVGRLMQLFRDLAASSVLTTTIDRSSNVAQTFQQAVDAVAVGTAALMRGISKTVAAGAVLTAAVNRLLSVSITVNDLLATSVTASAGLFRQALAVALVIATSFTNRATHARTIAGQLMDQVDVTALLHALRSIIVNNVLTPVITRATSASQFVQETIAVGLSMAATMTREIAYRLQSAVALSGALSQIKSSARTISASALEAVGVNRLQVYGRMLASRVEITPAVNTVASLFRTMSSAVVLAGAVGHGAIISKAISAAVHLSGEVRILVGKLLSASLLMATGISRLTVIVRTVAALTIMVGAQSKSMSLFRTIAATAVLTYGMIRGLGTEIVSGIHAAHNRVTQSLRGGQGLVRRGTEVINRAADNIKERGRSLASVIRPGKDDTNIY